MKKKNKNNYSNIICSNCGKRGHIYRICKEPKTSLGIICYKYDESKLTYLLIRRKYSHGYVELFRGKYKLYDIDFLQRIIDEMTIQEKQNITTKEFEQLWNELWMNPNMYHYTKNQLNEYHISLSKFKKLQTGDYYNKQNLDTIINFEYFINKSKTNWFEPEWGFPKGRRKIKEPDLDCAIREFKEETGLENKDFTIKHNFKPKIELLTGTNNIQYKHIYYTGFITNNNKILNIDVSKFEQVSEIGNIGYYSYKKCMELIRPYNIEKKQILTEINKEVLYYLQK